MVNPFTSFAFPASGAGVNTNITLPTRLAYVKNVKDFGAKGDGVTDDWAAIMAAFNWTTAGSPNSDRGTIYFPPGTYLISQPLDVSDIVGVQNIFANFKGVGALSQITGNFADYLLKRATTDTSGSNGSHVVESLSFLNTNASGGGIRWGQCVGGAIRDCIVTANFGINTASSDTVSGVASLEVNIENCTVMPFGSNVSGSVGIMNVADGLVLNCLIKGFDIGARQWGQEGNQNIVGCRFELCNVGYEPGIEPGGTPFGGGGPIIGCYFLNCGIGIKVDQTSCEIVGCRIESTNATVFGSTPQSGIVSNAAPGPGIMGVYITGRFSNAGVDLSGATSSSPGLGILRGIAVNNTGSGTQWKLPGSASVALFRSVNVAPVYAMSLLPAATFPISSISWSSGSGLVTVVLGGVANLTQSTYNINIQGVTPAGYNQVVAGATMVNGATLTFPSSNPGASSGTGGTILVNAVVSGIPIAAEGDCYNVSDATTNTWGSNPVGGGSNHAKVRFNNNTNWSVVGI